MPHNDEQQSPVGGGRTPVKRIGDFELEKRLGKGGMGEVFLARQVSLDRLVALKTLSKVLSQQDDYEARFLREARSMAKLDHPNVVKVADFGLAKVLDEDVSMTKSGTGTSASIRQLPIGLRRSGSAGPPQ